MSKLRIGLIGAGGRGVGCFAKSFVNEHADKTELVAIADSNTVRARKAVELLKIKADVHGHAADLTERKDLDAVVICSPDCMHEEHALLALQNGKHVYVEKPLAITVEGCLRVTEAARASGKTLSMGFNLRHHAVVRNLHALVQQGVFGEIFSIQAIEHYTGGKTYHSRWNRLQSHTGGLFIHKGSHDFDVINHLMGPTVRPARVACFANVFTLNRQHLPFVPDAGVEPGPRCSVCPYKDRCPDAFPRVTALFDDETAAVDGYYPDICMYLSDKDTHDQGIAIVEYDNGATASHSEYFATPSSNRRYLIEGTGAHGEGDFHGSWVRYQPRWSNDEVERRIGAQQGGHGGADPGIIETFLNSVRTGSKPTATAVDGIWSVAIGVAAEKARAENRVVEISELMDVTSDLLR